MTSAWINRRIVITPNELFDNGGEGTVVAVESGAVSLKLSVSIKLANGKECHHLVASIRHSNKTIDEIMAGNAILCALTLVPADKFDSTRPFDISWWRGGGAAIGEIRAAPPSL